MPDVSIDQRAIDAMFSDWDSDVGRAIRAATDVVADAAVAMAPVSPVGSKYAPPGYLKEHTRQAVTLHHGDDGHVLGLVGAVRYPFSFISNAKGYTDNPRAGRRRGRASRRRAEDNYLGRALDALAGFTWGGP